MGNALLVVDMVVGFMEPGHNLYCGDDARQIVPRVQRLIEDELAKGSSVFFICDNHDPDDLEFQMFPVHCVKGTEEAEVIGELAGYDGVVMCTDICVMHTASDARNRDYAVEIPADCVASFDPSAHAYALDHMGKILGATVTRPEPAA